MYIPSETSQVALVVKNLPANAGDIRDMHSVPGSLGILWSKDDVGNSRLYFYPNFFSKKHSIESL